MQSDFLNELLVKDEPFMLIGKEGSMSMSWPTQYKDPEAYGRCLDGKALLATSASSKVTHGDVSEATERIDRAQLPPSAPSHAYIATVPSSGVP